MCRMSWKSGSLKLLEPSGPHRACYGTYTFTFTRCYATGCFVLHSFLLLSVGECLSGVTVCLQDTNTSLRLPSIMYSDGVAWTFRVVPLLVKLQQDAEHNTVVVLRNYLTPDHRMKSRNNKAKWVAFILCYIYHSFYAVFIIHFVPYSSFILYYIHHSFCAIFIIYFMLYS